MVGFKSELIVQHGICFTEFEVDRKPRVMSAFIRKMSEDQLLIPEESISMSSIIGQGVDIIIIYDSHIYFEIQESLELCSEVV